MRKNIGELYAIVLAAAVSLILCSDTAWTAGATIPYPDGIRLGGAAAYLGKVDVKNSPYFKAPDYYSMTSNSRLTILGHFATYQQTTEYTCGPAAAVMVLYHYGVAAHEMEIARAAGSNEDTGTTTMQLADYFKSIGWKVESSIDSAKTPSLKFLRSRLKQGIPVMVEWIDWGGHWQVVIGYDTMGTSTESDDVIIFADPYDTGDHQQDGYYTYPAERFLYMWFDAHYFPENMRNRQWLIAVPQKR